MKLIIQTTVIGILATAIVSLVFWLVTGALNIIAPIMGLITALLYFKASNDENF